MGISLWPGVLGLQEMQAGAGSGVWLGLVSCPHALLPPSYSLVRPHAAVGPSGVPGVQHLPRVSVRPGWRQGHTTESQGGRGGGQAAVGGSLHGLLPLTLSPQL